MNSKIKKELLYSGKFYERLFVGVTLFSFTVWLLMIFMGGEASKQFELFFRQVLEIFSDTINVVGYSALRDPYNNVINGLAEKAYPPLSYFLMYFLSRLVDIDKYYEAGTFWYMHIEMKFLMIFFICAVITILVFYELIRYYKKGGNKIKSLTAFAIILSAPFVFNMERANLVTLAAILVLFYIFNYDSTNKILKELALISLAIVGALKITPAMLGILLLFNKQWKEAARAILYGIIVGFVPFFFLEGGLSNFILMIRNLILQGQVYTSEQGCTLLAIAVHYGISSTEMLAYVENIITYIVCASFVLAAYISDTTWERVLFICMVLIILPSHSGYYCILYMIPAMLMFLNEDKHKGSDIILLLAFLMITCPVQSIVMDLFFNYHLALLLITVVMFYRSICYIKKFFKEHEQNTGVTDN